jgi:hypothetical protein
MNGEMENAWGLSPANPLVATVIKTIMQAMILDFMVFLLFLI